MLETSISILLVEDNQYDMALFEKFVRKWSHNEFIISTCMLLSDMEEIFKALQPSIVVMDLSLPDSKGISTLYKALSIIGDTPVIVLTGSEDEKLGLEAVQAGAEDFLYKTDSNERNLARAILYAYERNQEKNFLREQSNTDPLTGLLNRRYFLNRANEEFKRARRYSHLLCLGFIDLDHFKHINDIYGHQCGDHILQKFADICKSNLRGSDMICRFGGDELVFLLPETAIDYGFQITERIRKQFQETPTKIDTININHTLSAGLSALTANHKDLKILLQSADEALYIAKGNGQNQTVIHKCKGDTYGTE